MKSVEYNTLSKLSGEAAQTARLRKNLNLHLTHDDPIQRLCNALDPGAYARPHRHPPHVWECIILLQGGCTILVFDSSGCVIDQCVLGRNHAAIAEIPAGAWHSIAAIAPATVVMEVKPGPFIPGEFALWAPAEDDAAAASCKAWLSQAELGQRYGC